MQKINIDSAPPKKNILMVSPWDQTIGGVVYVFRHLSESLKSEEFDPIYLFPDYNYTRVTKGTNAWGEPAYYFKLPDLSIPQKKIRSFLVGLALYPRTIFILVRFLKQKEIRLINCHFLMGHYLCLALAAKILGIPFITSMHGADVPPLTNEHFFYRLILKWTLKLSSQIVSCSQAFSHDILAAYSGIQSKTKVISNGLNLSEFSPNPKAETFPDPYLLCVALHVEKKGIDILLKAFESVSQKFPQYHLLLAGYGPLLENHRELAKSLKLEAKVHFLGGVERDRIQSLYQSAELFILPSRQEPFGIVLLEASFYQKAIVAARVGGIPEIIQDAQTGLLFETENIRDLSDKMNVALESSQLRTRLGKAARARLFTHFTWEQCTSQYSQLFRTFTSRKN